MAMTPEMRESVFALLATALQKQCPPMICVKDTAAACEIIGNIPVPYGSTKKIVPGMHFASAVKRKEMVSFYFMPIYYHHKDFAPVAPVLIRRLKGKACFNFTKADQIEVKELEALLRKGAQAWRKLGYVR